MCACVQRSQEHRVHTGTMYIALLCTRTMYKVHVRCTMYIVLYVQVRCTMYYIIYYVPCTSYYVPCTGIYVHILIQKSKVRCTRYDVHSRLLVHVHMYIPCMYYVPCTLYLVHGTMYYVHSTMYTST